MSYIEDNSKVKLSEQGKEEVENKLDNTINKWTRRDDSIAITEANEYLFKVNIWKTFQLKEDEDIKIEQLKKLAQRGDFTTDNKNQDNNSRNKLYAYIYELEKQNKTGIRVERLLKFIRDNKIHWKGISYSSWKKYYKGECVAQYVFNAYCYVLGLDEEEYKIKRHQNIANKFNQHCKENILVDILSTFNHKQQITSLEDSLYQNQRVFLINNKCLYSRTWMLRRLEKYLLLNVYGIRRCEYFPSQKFSIYTSLSIDKLKEILEEEYPSAQPKKLVNILEYNHLFFVIDINNYDLERLKELIEKLWQPFVNKIQTVQRGKQESGKLIMFLLTARDEQKNERLNGELQSVNNLAQEIVELKHANPFSSTEHIKSLEDVVRKIRLNFEELSEIPNETPEEIARYLIFEERKDKDSSEELLEKIYEYFHVNKTTEFAKTWQRYP